MRLVSLCPSLTESLVALGAGGDLVGATRYCVHPREALAGVRRVGGTKNPDLAAIRLLAPDLVLANAEENREQDLAALARDLPVDVSHPRTVAEVPALLRRLGELTGRAEAGDAWARRVEERLAAVRARAWAPFRFVYLIWKEPWMAAVSGTYIADLIATFGGVDALGGTGGPYPRVTAEEVAASRPGWIFLPDEPYRFADGDREWWSRLVPACRVELVAGDDLCWHGVRTLRGLDLLERLLGGEGR